MLNLSQNPDLRESSNMRLKNVPLKPKLVIFIVVGVFLILAVSTAVIVGTVTSQEEKLAYEKSIEMAGNYANQFDAQMEANQAIARTLACTMAEYGSQDREEAMSIIKRILNEVCTLLQQNQWTCDHRTSCPLRFL